MSSITVNTQMHPAERVLVVSGYGVRVHVERGQLVIEDGIADDRRRLCIPRVSPDLKRLIVLGHVGTVSLDAQKWLHQVGIAYVHLDGDGGVLSVGNSARTRRCARLARTGVGTLQRGRAHRREGAVDGQAHWAGACRRTTEERRRGVDASRGTDTSSGRTNDRGPAIHRVPWCGCVLGRLDGHVRPLCAEGCETGPPHTGAHSTAAGRCSPDRHERRRTR